MRKRKNIAGWNMINWNRLKIRLLPVIRQVVGMHLIKGKSIFIKILLLMTIVSIVSGGLILGLSVNEQASAMEEDIIRHHIVLADVASQSIEAGYLAQRWPFETLKEISECESVLFWWIVKPDGEILLADDAGMWGKQINDESLEVSKTVVVDSAFPKTGENIKLIVHPLDIKEEGERCWFYLGISLESAIDARNKMIVDGVGFFVAIIIIVIFISAYFTKTITGPIIKLTEGVKAISQGNLDYSITVKTEDEVGVLAENFDKMTRDLKKSRMKLEEYNKTLEKKVAERTEKLHESKENLERTVVDLQKNRYATLNIMRDLRKTVASKEKAEKEVRELNKNLERKVNERTADVTKLLEQKDEIIHMIGHDLKNPLGPLLILLPIVEGKVEDPKLKEMLQVSVRNAESLKEMLFKTLEFAKQGELGMKVDFSNICLNENVSNLIESRQVLFTETNVAVENKIDEKIMVNADKLLLDEVFDNLFTNAVKYSQENGGMVTVDALEENDFVKVSVKDTGIGLTEEQLSHIFDKFYKNDDVKHIMDSHGLGLPICKRIVEKHGGKIWAESQGEGKGTTMFFTLPVSKNEVK